MKVYSVEWKFVEYEGALYQVYLYANNEDEARQRAIQECQATDDLFVHEIEIL